MSHVIPPNPQRKQRTERNMPPQIEILKEEMSHIELTKKWHLSITLSFGNSSVL